MSEYRVIITETLKRAVTVEAESREEAEEAVRRQYQNSEHILVAEDFDGRAVVGKVDVDEQAELARRFGIMSIPTLIVMKGGKVVEQAVGARGKADIAAMLERHL